jgi:TrmH family RNA methyltransferase
VAEQDRLGRGNPLIRRLRALRRDRRLRDREDVLVAEGLHLVQEALACGAHIEQAVVSPRLGDVSGGPELRLALERGRVPVAETADDTLGSVQDARSAQPVLAVVRRPPTSPSRVLECSEGPPLIVLAHAVQDPGNLGSIVRSADAAGATGLLAVGAGCDLFHPRAVRATMGSIFRLPVATDALDRVLPELQERGIAVLGAVPAAAPAHTAVDLTGPLALLLGAEGRGLEPALLAGVDGTLCIPMRGGVESLSVGAAAAVLLFEAARQRARGRDATG